VSLPPDLVGALLVVYGYLSGSISWGVVVARVLLGVDVRTVGSGNIGATNVARAGGKKLGIAVLVLDALKAVIPMLVARWLLAGTGREAWTIAVGVAAFVGHLWPLWLLWRGGTGGKGVATALGVFVVLSPWAALAGLVCYAAAYLATRISSVGSLAGTAGCVAGTFVTCGWSSPEAWAAVVLGLLIVLRHRDNIRRLVRGEERKMKV
jgi:glycerol-3-phosphate acyltransferase PlsY